MTDNGFLDDFPEELALVALVAYNNKARRWFHISTGRFVSKASVVSEMARHRDATFRTLDALTRQLYAGSINVQQWQLAVASELKDAHLAQSMFAVGGRRNMTQANFGRVGGTLRNQFRFLDRFANQIAAGQVSERQALARIRQYGKATQQSYWREFAEIRQEKLLNWTLHPGDHCEAGAGTLGCVDLANNSPYTAKTLPTYPGAGATTCRGNCNCTIDEA